MTSFTLTVVRHGQTESNVAGVRHGQTESPLTATGRRQAELTGHALRNQRFSHAVSSDLGRAKETCKLILAAQNAPPTPSTDRRLREKFCGELEGRSTNDIDRMRSQGVNVEQMGESMTELALRLHNWFIDVCANMHLNAKEPLHDRNASHAADALTDSHVLVVSHWGSIVELFKIFKNVYNCKFNVEHLPGVANASISQFNVSCHKDEAKGSLEASVECVYSHSTEHLKCDK